MLVFTTKHRYYEGKGQSISIAEKVSTKYSQVYSAILSS